MRFLFNLSVSFSLTNRWAACHFFSSTVSTPPVPAPVIPLSPKHTALFNKPIYIVYDHQQRYKFIQVVKRTKRFVEEQPESFLPTTASSPCRCGKGAKKEGSSCTTTRCKCFLKQRPCKDCNCSNCDNLFGKRELQENNSFKPISRKRRRHETTSQAKTNIDYLMETNKTHLPASKWSVFEQIVLVELSRTLFNNETFDIDLLCSVITNINKYNIPNKRTFVTRSKNEISKQVFYAIAVDNAYQKLLREQLRMNST